jgi:hypothetical protein
MESDYAPLVRIRRAPRRPAPRRRRRIYFLQGVETNKRSIYNPFTNSWTEITPPSGWSTIGDSPACVLPNGIFMMGQGGFPSKKQVLFNAATLTWTAVGTGKVDSYSEEGFALTPSGSVLVVGCENGTNSKLAALDRECR